VSDGNRLRLGLGLLIAVAAVAIAAAGLALAAGVKQRSATVSLAGDDTAKTKASCPEGTALSASGFKTTTNETVGVIVNKLDPRGVALKAGATALSGPPDGGELTATAYCAKPSEGKLTRVTKGTSIPAGGSGNATVTCPKGTSVRNGGFQAELDPPPVMMRRNQAVTKSGGLPPGRGVTVTGLKRVSKREWRATGRNAGSQKGKLTAIAQCGKGPKLTKASASDSNAAAPGSTVAEASCPSGQQVAFGGYTTPSSSYVRLLRRTSDRTWKAAVFSFSPSDVTALAYCSS